MNDNGWLFVAAAKGIQRYVLSGDKLTEMIGASERVDRLPRQVLNALLREAGVAAKPLTQAAGGARLLCQNETDARRLALLWPAIASNFAPGLEMACAIAPVDDRLGTALTVAENRLLRHRNEPQIPLPPAGPLVARNPRSGLPAVTTVNKDGWLDIAAARQRLLNDPAHFGLLGRVIPDKAQAPAYRRNFDDFVQSGSNYVAVLHADVNGLGQAVQRMIPELDAMPLDEATDKYTRFSAATARATEAAAQSAVGGYLTALQQRTGRPIEAFAFRPIVCAGEDFTAVMQADDAVDFVRTYLTALEQQSAAALRKLGLSSLPAEGFTACAGIVFCKRNYPFLQAYAVAESLCAYAKKHSGRRASALAFTRIKSSLTAGEGYADIVEAAFTSAGSVLTMNPYHVGDRPRNGLPSLAGLEQLRDALQGVPRNQLREFVSRVYDGPDAADLAFERLEMLLEDRNQERKLEALKEGFRAVSGAGLWEERQGQSRRTPLYDALELLQFSSARPSRQPAGQRLNQPSHHYRANLRRHH
ncbi:MAG: hypothetical protein HY735_35610 [Verrucomicrobia bacterium]|nr:hypothetical protein [Verrucomicrobiota bacterium]